MKAIVIDGKNSISLREVPTPQKAMSNHLLIEMKTSAVNSGDKLFIAGAFPRGIPLSKYAIAGVSGVGRVVETGEGVPDYYKGKDVTVYRSLHPSEATIGTWSEYAHLHYLNCAVLPDHVNSQAYPGSLVNIITPYAFFQQMISEGHKGIICTAGNSATGIAMLGICLANNFPIISIVRTEKGKIELESLGAKNIVVQQDVGFKQQLKEISEQQNATSVFDGVGGRLLTDIIDVIPFNSTIYAYGFLDQESLFSINTKVLMKGIIIKGFSNYRTQTVVDEKKLEQALNYISNIIHMQHFITKEGSFFGFDEMNEALKFSSEKGKAIFKI